MTKNGSSITLSNTKMKDAEPPPDMAFALHTVEIEPDVSSAVLVEGKAVPVAAKLKGLDKLAMQVLVDVLAAHGEIKIREGLPVDQKSVSLEHWHESCDQLPLSRGSNPKSHRSAFSTAKSSLLQQKVIGVSDGDVWIVQHNVPCVPNRSGNAGNG